VDVGLNVVYAESTVVVEEHNVIVLGVIFVTLITIWLNYMCK
jgi:hypothetical protein